MEREDRTSRLEAEKLASWGWAEGLEERCMGWEVQQRSVGPGVDPDAASAGCPEAARKPSKMRERSLPRICQRGHLW